MKLVREILIGAVLLGITITLIITLVNSSKKGERTTYIVGEKIDKFNQSLEESEIVMYEGQDVKGSDVISFIKKNLGGYDSTDVSDMYVYVKTNKSENTYVNAEYIKDIQDFTKNRYIKPIANFKCDITRDTNDMIIGVNYTQQ